MKWILIIWMMNGTTLAMPETVVEFDNEAECLKTLELWKKLDRYDPKNGGVCLPARLVT